MYVILAEGSGPAIEVRTAFMNLTVTDIVFEPSITSTWLNIRVESKGSPVSVDIDKISVNETEVTDTTPALPYKLDPNATVTFTLRHDWADLQNKTVTVAVRTTQGYVAAKSVNTPQMRLGISSPAFDPVTASYFNITVESSGSPVSVDIDKISVNETEVTDTTPALPYKLDPNATVTFTLRHDWADLQNKTVTVAVRTTQGYVAAKSVNTPQMKLGVSSIAFDSVATSYFNITIENSQASAAKVDINLITANVEGQNITIEITDPALPQSLEPSSDPLLLKCTWDWSSFKGKSVIITVYTAQGFKGSMETTVPNTP